MSARACSVLVTKWICRFCTLHVLACHSSMTAVSSPPFLPFPATQLLEDETPEPIPAVGELIDLSDVQQVQDLSGDMLNEVRAGAARLC